MRTKTASTFITIISVLFLVVLLSLIRAFESKLFYDPFLNYFKEGFKMLPFPDFDPVKLGFNLFLRYLINTVLSLGIIFAIFRKRSLLKFTAFLYVIFFVILIVLFYLILFYKGSESAWLLFYVRRFLIQPIFVLLFIPAFYYQFLRNQNNK